MHGIIARFISAAYNARYMTLAGTLLIIIAGIFAWRSLPIEAYPELANPQVRVITLFPGKGPEEVERLVTIPLEKELNGIPGETALRSISLYGLSAIIVTFSDGTLTTLARQQVLERISQADLPPDAEPGLEPDVGSLREVYRYALHSKYYTAMGMRAIQNWELEKLFRQVPGVIGVVSEGGPVKAYQVDIDPYKLRARDISLNELFDAVASANATSGGGFIEKNGHALIVREMGLLKGVPDIENIVIKANEKGVPIKVRDVARVSIGALVRRGQVGKDHNDDIVQGIILLRRGENPTKVLEGLYKRLPGIVERIPKGIAFETLYDRSDLVRLTLKTVGTNISIGIALVIILLCLFLVDIVPALLTACVLPIAMLVAFICLSLLGVPSNLLSLGAIDFGILVDSAVVMIENIVRRLAKEGQDLSPQERVYLINEAAREMGTPIVFGIAVVAITFMPILTFTGVEGKLFRPLATTMVTALIGAGFATLTLVPVLCSFFLVKRKTVDRESFLISISRKIYKPALTGCLKHPLLTIAVATSIFAASIMLFMQIGKEFLPHLEEGNIWLRATVKPASVTVTESALVAHKVREKLLKYPEVKMVFSQVGGPDDGTDPARFADQEYFVDLKPAKEWRPQFDEKKDNLVALMRKDLEQIPGVSYYFTQYIQTTLDESLSGVQGSLVAKVTGADLATLEKLGQHVGHLMKETPGIVDVIVDPILGQPQFAIEINREAAARYGINVKNVRELVEIAIGGSSATKVIEGERRFDVMVRLAPKYRSTEEALSEVLIDTPAGEKIPLSQIATLKEVSGATQIWRDAGSRLATIRANVRGRDLASAVDEAQMKVKQEIRLPEGYRVEWSGEFQRQREASEQLAIVLPVTLVIIITILYFSCGTLRGAIVMFSVVPLASIGAILSLKLTGIYFSIAAGVGIIALFGVAVQNGILLVFSVNELRHDGLSIEEAVFKGALTRMRPVLMTASIAAIGLLPAAVSNEIGSQTQKPFAVVIIGGLISSTLLTLLVLPAIYQRVAPRLVRRKVKSQSIQHETVESE